jgi:GntR family transcriptional regulator
MDGRLNAGMFRPQSTQSRASGHPAVRELMNQRITKKNAVPRYRVIANKLLADIGRGRYPLGGALPTEIELCKRFDASRHTVREALRAITLKGLITRKPRAGSVVIATEQPTVFTHSVGSLNEWLSYPNDTFRDTFETKEIVAGRELAMVLKCSQDTRWFRISSIRRFNNLDIPLAWTDIYVDPKYAAVVKRRDHGRIPVHQEIEKMFGVVIERAQLEIFPSSVAPRMARALKVAPNSSAMTIIRRYTGLHGDNFETTVTVHPENRYTFTMDLHRELKAFR